MMTINPFSILAESIPSIAIQVFVIAMISLVLIGTLIDIIHKKNVKYFFNNAKKAKLSATKEISTGERVAVIAKTVVHHQLNAYSCCREYAFFALCSKGYL